MTQASIECLGIYYSSSGLIAQLRVDNQVGIWDKTGVEYLIQESANNPDRSGILTQILSHLNSRYPEARDLTTDDLFGQTSLLPSS